MCMSAAASLFSSFWHCCRVTTPPIPTTPQVQWENLADGTLGHGVYTSSWAAPKADVHSQQRFFYMGTKVGELSIDYGWWSMVNVLITGLLIVVEVGCKWNMWIVDGWSVIVCGCVYIIC